MIDKHLCMSCEKGFNDCVFKPANTSTVELCKNFKPFAFVGGDLPENKIEVKYTPTPREIAKMIWAMGSDDQAEMFKQLLDVAGSEHNLMMQFMAARDDCEARRDNALAAFQAMFSSAYKYMGA